MMRMWPLGEKTALKTAEQTVIQGDFAKFLDAVSRYEKKRGEHQQRREAGEDVDPIGPYSIGIENTRERQGIRWFNDEVRDGSDKKKWANPDDYLGIRDNKAKLTKFVTKILDLGPHTAAHTRDDFRELHPSEYLIWLHQHSEYQPFRSALEEVVTALTLEELNRAFQAPNVAQARKEAAKDLATYHPEKYGSLLTQLIGRDNLSGVLWRLGIQHNCPPQHRAFAARILRELLATERPATVDEIVKTYAGGEEHLREEFSKGAFNDVKTIHPNETSAEFQGDFQQWYIEKKAAEKAEMAASKQYDRLIGLLEVVSAIGSPTNATAALAEPLKVRFESGFFSEWAYRGFDITFDPYQMLIGALGAVKRDDQSRATWLSGISATNIPTRAMTMLAQGLDGCKTRDDKESFVADALSIMRTTLKGEDFELTTSVAGFLKTENIGDMLGRHVAQLIFKSWRLASFFDEKEFTLGFTQPKFTNEGVKFPVTFLGPGQVSSGEVFLQPFTSALSGDTSLQDVVRKYIDEVGLPLDKSVSVTSFEARKVGDGSKLFENLAADHARSIEGILGINTVHLYFLLSADGQLKFGLPELEGCYLFAGKSTVDERTLGFDAIKAKIPMGELKIGAQLEEEISKQATTSRKGGMLGSMIYLLDGKLTSPSQELLRSYLIARCASVG